jgi:hypothetical protein
MTLVFLLVWFSYSPAELEWDVQRTLQVKEKSRDVAMSLNGEWIFVLTEKGEILVYSADGTLSGRVSVGNDIDGIKVGSRENILLLTSQKDSTIKIITMDFIQSIDVTGSPFKGPAEAPVAVAVFTDFQ